MITTAGSSISGAGEGMERTRDCLRKLAIESVRSGYRIQGKVNGAGSDWSGDIAEVLDLGRSLLPALPLPNTSEKTGTPEPSATDPVSLLARLARFAVSSRNLLPCWPEGISPAKLVELNNILSQLQAFAAQPTIPAGKPLALSPSPKR